MGLFDFVKDVGNRIFDTDAEAAENIKQHLEIKTSGISNIEVEFDDGVATICGDCVNQATRDNAVLMVGNIAGVSFLPFVCWSQGAWPPLAYRSSSRT